MTGTRVGAAIVACLASAALLASGPPTGAAEPGGTGGTASARLEQELAAGGRNVSPECAASVAPATPREVDTYDGCRATGTNWDRVFPDRRVSTVVDGVNTVDLTTSTALAGAVASLRVNGREFLASGGHGAALQYALHDTPRGECYNPTEAGSKTDDSRPGWPAPFHGPSTSSLLATGSDARSIWTTTRMAMYVPEGEVSDWDGCTGRYPAAAPFSAGLSPYVLHKRIELGVPGVATAARFDTTVDVEAPERVADFDATLIGYLQEDFTHYYTADPSTGLATELPAGRFVTQNGVSYASGGSPVVAATGDGAHAIGLYTPEPLNGRFGEQALYTVGRSSADGGYGFDNRTLQVTYYARDVVPGPLRYSTYVVVGNVDRVAHDLAVLHARHGSMTG